LPPAATHSVIFTLSDADKVPPGGMVPRSTAAVFILLLFAAITLLFSKFKPPAADDDVWQPEVAQLASITDFTARNFGPGVSLLLSSVSFEQAGFIH
jgi:hypothetical protein